MTPDAGYLAHLYKVILSRRGASPDESYVAKLFGKGRAHIAQKVGEEAVETAIAAVAEGKKELIAESADLVFHLLVLWAQAGIPVEDVLKEMQRREGVSGIAEKKKRRL